MIWALLGMLALDKYVEDQNSEIYEWEEIEYVVESNEDNS